MTEVWRLPLQAPRKMVLLALADNANDEGTDCWPSVGKLVEKCSMSERAVQGHLAALEAAGYIKRQERLGRSNKYILFVDCIRSAAKAHARCSKQQSAGSGPLQNLHTTHSNPRDTHTPAKSAPPQKLQPTPAESAPITTQEPSITTTTYSIAIENGGSKSTFENLHFPVCTPEESIAISELLISCPVEFRQKALDEIEGARQARVIKTNLVPFARGIMTAIARGSFTVGHGAKVLEQRIRHNKQCFSRMAIQDTTPIDPDALSKGLALLEKIRCLRFKI